MSDIFRRKQPGEAWETAVVSSGGGGSPGGVSGDVQYNNAGSFGGIQQSLFDVDPTTGAVTISPSDINASPLKAILDGTTVAEIYSNGDGTVGLQLNDVGVTPGTFTVDPASGIKFGSPTALFNVSEVGAVTISPSDPGIDVLTLSGSGTAAVRIVDGLATIVSDDDKAITLTDVASWANTGDGIYWEPDGLGSGSASFFVGADYVLQAEAAKLGFFGHTAVAKPTGVAVTAGGIHAALVTLGLIAA